MCTNSNVFNIEESLKVISILSQISDKCKNSTKINCNSNGEIVCNNSKFNKSF